MLLGGYYDPATPYFQGWYEMHHLPMPDALQANISYHYYESGHMVYAKEASLKALHDDVAAFIARNAHPARSIAGAPAALQQAAARHGAAALHVLVELAGLVDQQGHVHDRDQERAYAAALAEVLRQVLDLVGPTPAPSRRPGRALYGRPSFSCSHSSRCQASLMRLRIMRSVPDGLWACAGQSSAAYGLGRTAFPRAGVHERGCPAERSRGNEGGAQP